MKFITLTMVVKESITRGGPVPPIDPEIHEPSGEDDGIESLDQDNAEQERTSAEVVSIAPTYQVTESKPVTIGVDSIRNFYPRKNDAPGTRIVLKSGVAYVVAELHDEVLNRINALG